MPVKGLKEVREKLRKELANISGPLPERTLLEVLIVASGFAATMTPIDTGNLIGSQFRRVETSGTKVKGTLAYTAAYAAAVHDKPGTLKDATGKKAMRDPKEPKRGKFWDPDAEPEFLRKAFEDSDARANIDAVIARRMKI